MPQPEILVRVHRGRTRHIQVQVKRWRKRMARYYPLRSKILDLVLTAHKGDATAAFDFLATPLPSLSGKTPRQLLKPATVQRLYLTLKRHFASGL